MNRPIATIEHRQVKLHRVWSRRHWRVLATGMICAAIYGWGLRWAEYELAITVPNWIVAVTAQAAMLIGGICARLAWFD